MSTISRLLVLIVCVLGPSPVFAYTQHDLGEANSVSAPGGALVGVSYNGTAHTITWNLYLPQPGGGLNTGGWVYKVSGNGSKTAIFPYIDVGPATTQSYTGTSSVDEGDWLVLAARRTYAGGVDDYFVWFHLVSGVGCPDVPYDFTVSASGSTRNMVILSEPTSGDTSTVVASFSVSAGTTEHRFGTVHALCGAVRLYDQDSEGQLHLAPENAKSTTTPKEPAPPAVPDPEHPTIPDIPTTPIPSANPVAPSDVTSSNEDLWGQANNKLFQSIAENAKYIAARQKEIAAAGGYMSDRLKSIDENIAVMKKNDVDRMNAENDAIANTPLVGAMKAQGEAAAEAAVTAAGGDLPTPAEIEIPGDAPDFAVHVGHGSMDVTFDLNPFTEDRFGPMAAWLKALIA